jgi:hypothetical protein
MPIERPDLSGTEKDGSRSLEYCKYCYQNGEYVNPTMSLDEMKKLVEEKMTEMKLNSGIINMTLNALPELKRWKAGREIEKSQGLFLVPQERELQREGTLK